MAAVTLQTVTKSYDGKNQIIQPLNITINDGEFMVMVGPSGCGKSTLLRMVAGLERVTSGDIYIDDRRVTDMEPKDRGIAMVFQNYALYPHMTVGENMAYGLKIRGMGKEQITQRVMDAARSLELDHLLQRRPRELSGGQRQRVALARCLVRAQPVLLLDEPFSALDPALRQEMLALVQDVCQRQQLTMLMVSHSIEDAARIAPRSVVIAEGRILWDGKTEELLSGKAGASSLLGIRAV